MTGQVIALRSHEEPRSELRKEHRAARGLKTDVIQSLFETSWFLMGAVELDRGTLRFLAANPAAAHFLGSTADEVVGKTAEELSNASTLTQHLAVRCKEAERRRGPIQFEYQDGSPGDYRQMKATICPIANGRGSVPRYSFILEDCTTARQTRQQSVVERSMTSLGQLAGSVAHESNNPLSSVVSGLQFLQDHLQRIEKDVPAEWLADAREAIVEASQGAERVRTTVSQLHQVARDSSPTVEPLDLHDLVESSVLASSQAFGWRSVVMEWTQTPKVIGDEAKLEWAFGHLLTNALTSLPREGAAPVRISSATLPNSRVVVELRYGSQGGPSDPFSVSGRSFYSTRGSGDGLGLTIANCILREHGGELTMEAERSGGTLVRVILPSAAV